MGFSKINYKSLNPKQKEIYNFQKLAGILADYGFNCMKLSDDWNGADFLAVHPEKEETLRVQLKSRPSISKEYMGKDLHIAFPYNEKWYLINHDKFVEIIRDNTNWLDTESWLVKGTYNSIAPNQKLMAELQQFRLSSEADAPATE